MTIFVLGVLYLSPRNLQNKIEQIPRIFAGTLHLDTENSGLNDFLPGMDAGVKRRKLL